MKHLQYEGPELEELLDHVHNTHGTAAKIVKADKTREGGIAGFFTREVFQVIVAVDDEAEKVETEAMADEPRAPKTTDEDLWSIVAAGAAATSTEESGAEFAHTLGKLLSEEPPAPAKQPRSPRPAAKAQEVSNEGRTAHEPVPVPTDEIAPAVFPSHVSEVQVDMSVEEASEIQRAPEPIANEPVLFGSPIEPEVEEPVALAIRLSVPAHDHAQTQDHSSVVELSSRRIQRQVEGSGSFLELLSAFETANISAPSLPSSGVVAVVGSLSEAEPLASKMSEVSGGGAGDILILSPEENAPLPSASEIIGLAAQLRNRRGLSVVVIELTPGLGGHMWATQILAHLSATQVRLVVGAHRSPEGTSIAAQALGRVDVIDLVDLHDIEEPERFLELGIPVGSLDTYTPTSALWVAASVTSRMNYANLQDEAITQPGQLAR